MCFYCSYNIQLQIHKIATITAHNNIQRIILIICTKNALFCNSYRKILNEKKTLYHINKNVNLLFLVVYITSYRYKHKIIMASKIRCRAKYGGDQKCRCQITSL